MQELVKSCVEVGKAADILAVDYNSTSQQIRLKTIMWESMVLTLNAWKWDRLLSMETPLLGFAHDDAHSTIDVGHAWLIVKAEEDSAKAILQAIKNGNFYCSTGVNIIELGWHQDRLYLDVKDETSIRVIGSGGKVLAENIGTYMEWDFSENETEYARFHIRDSCWRQGWSQPFFKKVR